ncbi:hypothetical protein BOX15_Mlig024626g3 [Macrostomum lignano]|uniref:DUF4806 domain-containing protein n=2 Tax=Macrostomum lignano TaxID=282301 RepID=A0A1I8IQY4_9PLAT|nr:hypothetical protein BOX15_Mlig024626g3 [Macrostomum lignano]
MSDTSTESEASLSTDYSAYSCQILSSDSHSNSSSSSSSLNQIPSANVLEAQPQPEGFSSSGPANPDAGNIEFEEELSHLPNFSALDDPCVQAALIYQWAITSGVSEAALDRLLKLILILTKRSNQNIPPSVKVLKSRLKEACSLDDSCVSELLFCSECKAQCNIHQPKAKSIVTLLNIVPQLRSILTKHLTTILKYEQKLQTSSNSDVLNSKIVSDQNLQRSSNKSIHLHLLVSADGANFFDNAKSSFWPFQAQILNLPVHIRQKFSNLILLALVAAKAIPHFQVFLPEIVKSLPKQFVFLEYNVFVHCTLLVCDLPALAKLFCIHQFNGAFSCPKCLHPGESIKVSEKGKNWVFRFSEAHIFPLRTMTTHIEHCRLAEIRKKPVFGVKSRSCLLDIISFPNCNPIDSLHCLFEGQIKFLLEEIFSPSNRHEPYFCSSSCSDFVSSCIRDSIIPPSISIQSKVRTLSDWKAKHYKNFALYFCFPTLVQRASHLPTKLLVTNLVLLYHLLYNVQSDKVDIEMLSKYFLLNAQNIFGPKILRLNFHLLLHMGEQYSMLGPVFGYSMFAFESAMGMFKKFLCGTVSFGSQLVSKFLYQKELHHLFSEVQDASILEAYNSIALEPSRSNGILKSTLAYVNGYFFSTFNSNVSTSNHLCVLSSGQICSIIRFVMPNRALVKEFNPIGSLFDFTFLSDPCPEDLLEWRQALYSVYKKCSSFYFVLITMPNNSQCFEKTVDLIEIERPCIAVPLPLFKKDCYCAIPLARAFEHD